VIGYTDERDPLVLTAGNIGRGKSIAGGAEGFIRVHVKIAEEEIDGHGSLLGNEFGDIIPRKPSRVNPADKFFQKLKLYAE
jgi:hypothetical protein